METGYAGQTPDLRHTVIELPIRDGNKEQEEELQDALGGY